VGEGKGNPRERGALPCKQPRVHPHGVFGGGKLAGRSFSKKRSPPKNKKNPGGIRLRERRKSRSVII